MRSAGPGRLVPTHGWPTDGKVLTAAHVVQTSDLVAVQFVDGTVSRARVIGGIGHSLSAGHVGGRRALAAMIGGVTLERGQASR